ncbi:unnamed protein product [Didymodactylos carnosus]|uniref:Uncharacterized protein n=1 Tax=Didymodactylos carnosus TaxID=1234261 RepID=A0A813T567_9BILA|nr:unnamed protein product [Didymodactylos carnosus]CAF1251020.1 unnamed protein product [Didymodactylos carnosus]CAF3594601.1 unnamed protein product [Didymodactylos carnosus]CAF4058377.1 unnamed protein product [Didymodactylos carnosus]
MGMCCSSKKHRKLLKKRPSLSSIIDSDDQRKIVNFDSCPSYTVPDSLIIYSHNKELTLDNADTLHRQTLDFSTSDEFKLQEYEDIQFIVDSDQITSMLSRPFPNSYTTDIEQLELELAAIDMNNEVTAPLSTFDQ